MSTINRYEMRAILDYLDDALSSSRYLDSETRKIVPAFESNLTWRIRMARERLLTAAIGDVEVEQPA